MASFSKLNILSIITITITFVSSLNPHQSFGFVRDETCEYYGMSSIRDPELCQAVAMLLSEAEGLRTDTEFETSTGSGMPHGRPTGCAYHPWGKIKQFTDYTTGDCDVQGFEGCFCIKESYGFVRDKTCEYYGMHSIENPTQCELAAAAMSEVEGLRTDAHFIDRTQKSSATVNPCNSHSECKPETPFCYSGQCTACNACHFCVDGVDGTCGPCDSNQYPLFGSSTTCGVEKPTGCSYYVDGDGFGITFGIIEQWAIEHSTAGDCDVNGYGGCFCRKDSWDN